MTEWDVLQQRFQAGSINRREFLGRAAVLGISAALATRAIAQTPRRGGHLIVALDDAATGDSLDPARYVGVYMNNVGGQIHDTLLEVDEQAKLGASLAESWDARVGGSQWVFKLRKGVTFHNGKELTAPDAVYSINHHREPNAKSPAKALLAPVTDIKATGKHEVTIVLESAYADLPYILQERHLAIIPEGASFTAGIGAGAFVLESFEPGVRTRVKRNPNYWRTDRAFLDSAETLAISNALARTSALQSGAIHLMTRVPASDAAQLAKHPQLQVFSTRRGGHQLFVMRCDGPPFDNNDLRLALKYAIDREVLMRTLLFGHGEIGNDQPIPSHDPVFAADIPQRSYDPDKARFYFKKSGYGGPIVLTAAPGVFPGGAVDAALLFQASAAKADITIQVERVPDDGYWNNIWRKKPFCASYAGGRAVADLALSTYYKSDAPWNDTFWKRPRFDDLLLAARKEFDPSKRKHMYREMQLMLRDEGGVIIPGFARDLTAAAKKVQGFPLNPVYGDQRAIKHLWLDA
jgi:peptide/nickel transport system substrate-binding protein